MKKSFLLLLFFFCTAAAFCAAVPEYLVIGKAPSRLEKYAEEELQLFWQKIYGKKLTVIPESKSSGKAVIYLGSTAFAQKNKVDITKFGEEEWLLKTVGNSLLISGGRPAGTLYGALNALRTKGWIIQLPVEDESRRKEYRLTEKGLQVLKNGRPMVARLEMFSYLR